MTIRCFRWDDAGAPQLGAASSLSVVLEKCLVDGYGTQAGLGWGKIKSPSGKVIAFQPQARAASRPWLFFDDRCGASFNGVDMTGSAWVRLYEGLTSIGDDAVVNSGAVSRLSVDGNNSFIKYRGKSGATLKWLVITDSEKDYFWLLTESFYPSGKGVFVLRAYGALPTVNMGDSYSFVYSRDPILNLPARDGNETWRGHEYLADSVSFINDGVHASLQVYADHGGITYDQRAGILGASLGGVQAPGKEGVIVTPNAVSNRLILVDAGLTICTSVPAVSASIRGLLGGMYAPLNSGVDGLGFRQLTEFSDVVGLDGRNLLSVVMCSPYAIRNPQIINGPSDILATMVFDLTGPW